MDRRPANDYQNYETGHSIAHRSQFVGKVRSTNNGWAEIETKNKFSVGDMIEIIHPSGNRIVKLEHMKDKNGAAIDVAAGSPTHVWIPVEGPAEGGLLARMF
jgi:putative protease